MKLIDRKEIQTWGERQDSKGNFPTLISRLIRATTPLGTEVNFPSGSDVFMGGWDGIVNCVEKREFVPNGISLWELGTESNFKKKAQSDYDKRTLDSLGFDTSKCTFIFVTTRFWKDKKKWCEERIKEGKWWDVKIYDSLSIEQWLDNAAATARWFSSYVGKYPYDGIITIEEYWKEWAIGPTGELPSTIITSGRENEFTRLLNFLNKPPNIIGVRATSKDEAIAFIIASAKQFEHHHKETFFSKSLVIDSPSNFRSVRINTSSLNLIAKFEDKQILYAAVTDLHHVLVPLGPDDTFPNEIIILPTIEREGQVAALISMGFSEDDAAKYSKEAGRNITILKRLLKFSQNKLAWTNPENVREIIPAMLIGRWDETKKGDRELIEKLAGEDYEAYSLKVNKWRDAEESPFIQIGETWRLTSPLDAWANLSPFLLRSDFEKLHESFMLALQNGNPKIKKNEDSSQAPLFFNEEDTFSSWAREGIIQSLILIGLYGEGLKIPNMPSPQLWVDNIVYSLLSSASGEIWASLNNEMPLIAEASPNSFFEAIYNSLNNESNPIMEMFVEKQSFISPHSNHTGLLWALEGLAWMPEYLYNASLVLSKLSLLDPGGSLSNRPINSLIEIFKPWHYQTLANYDERMEILKQITRKEDKIGWTLLMRMLPPHHDVAHPTHKLRWRMFDKSLKINHTYPEMLRTHSYIIDLLFSLFDNSEKKLSQLIGASESLNFKDRNKVLSFVQLNYQKVKQDEYITWHAIRKLLSDQRSFPDRQGAFTENELIHYEELYNLLEPTNKIQKYLWLFEEHWPEFPDATNKLRQERSPDQEQQKIDSKRIEALKIIYKEYGIEKVKELSKVVKQPFVLGDTLAKIITDDSEIFSLAELLNNDSSQLGFIHSFLYKKTFLNGLNWAFSLYEKLKTNGYNNKVLSQIFIPLTQSKQLWSFIDYTNEELKREYWAFVYPNFYHLTKEEKILGLNHLVEARRFFIAMDICYHSPDEFPSDLLITILHKAATEKTDETFRVREYEISRIFESLDKRSDIEHAILIQLEWLYLPVLSSYGAQRNPKILHDELVNNPNFFIDVIKWLYKPSNDETRKVENENISDELIQNRAHQAYNLLHSWKNIPGVNKKGDIDKDFLNNWIDVVRSLAEKAERLKYADAQIGQILAQYPEKNLNWPPKEICEVIERINTDSLKRNFSTAIFNKRGSSSRGPFDGGNIERGHAEYFSKLAALHKNIYPNVSSILNRLSKGYLADAKRMDEVAERDKLEY